MLPRRPFLCVAAFCTLASPAAVSADTPTFARYTLESSQIRPLPTSANGRDYQLFVHLPASYDSSPGKRYPVLYLCDGYWDFGLVCGFYGNLIYDKTTPEFIIVGFGYAGEKPDVQNLRTYDYTPVPQPDDPEAKSGGHAAEFLATIETQIIPFVEKEYRTDPAYRVLGGSSLGGLFTLYALFEKPALFNAYIAPSPATIWAGDWLARHEKAFAKNPRPLNTRLYLTAAAEEWPDFRDSILRFHQQFSARQYPGLHYAFRVIDDERHTGTKAESYNRGIRFAFAPLAPKD